MFSFEVKTRFVNMLILGHMAVKGDGLWNCVIPCSTTNGDISCNTACIQQDQGAGFCVPKLSNISNEKVCCCNNE